MNHLAEFNRARGIRLMGIDATEAIRAVVDGLVLARSITTGVT